VGVTWQTVGGDGLRLYKMRVVEVTWWVVLRLYKAHRSTPEGRDKLGVWGMRVWVVSYPDVWGLKEMVEVLRGCLAGCTRVDLIWVDIRVDA
jgi:hypothetical protein